MAGYSTGDYAASHMFHNTFSLQGLHLYILVVSVPGLITKVLLELLCSYCGISEQLIIAVLKALYCLYNGTSMQADVLC